MTMPHLMNCSHSPDGWCLECVKELWEERELLANFARDIYKNYDCDESAQYHHTSCRKCDAKYVLARLDNKTHYAWRHMPR